MSELIQQKIKNGEGFIEVAGLGIITAVEYGQLTDPCWSVTLADYQDQINFLNSEFENDKQLIQYDIDDLIVQRDNLIELDDSDLLVKYRLQLTELAKTYQVDDKEIYKKYLSDPECVSLMKKINIEEIKRAQGIEKLNKAIGEKQEEINKLTEKLNKRLSDIGKEVKNNRVAQNVDYKTNQSLKTRIFSQEDYKPIELESDPLELKDEIVPIL